MPIACYRRSLDRWRRRLLLPALLLPAVAAALEPAALVEQFRRDSGRGDPAAERERLAAVVVQLTALPSPAEVAVEPATRGALRAARRQSAATTGGGDSEPMVRLLTLLGLPAGDGERGGPWPGWYPLEDLAGLYRSDPPTILLLRSGDARTQQATLLHELVHAAQDRAVGLAAYYARHTATLDGGLAAAAVVEGEAQAALTLLAAERAAGEAEPAAVARALLERVDQLLAERKAPRGWYALRRFPYDYGLRLVLAARAAPQPRSFADLLAHPPRTTARLLHPERGDDAPPRPTRLQELGERLGPLLQGRSGYATTLGELVAAQLLDGGDADGWNGDHAVLVEREGKPPLAVWESRWRGAKEAEAFAAAFARAAQARLGAPAAGRIEPFQTALPATAPRLLLARKGERLVVIAGEEIPAAAAVKVAKALGM